MNNELEKRITELCDEAKENGQVFVFGDAVYTPDEARDAIMLNADDDIDYNFDGDEDAYLTNLENCACQAGVKIRITCVGKDFSETRETEIDECDEREISEAMEEMIESSAKIIPEYDHDMQLSVTRIDTGEEIASIDANEDFAKGYERGVKEGEYWDGDVSLEHSRMASSISDYGWDGIGCENCAKENGCLVDYFFKSGLLAGMKSIEADLSKEKRGEA